MYKSCFGRHYHPFIPCFQRFCRSGRSASCGDEHVLPATRPMASEEKLEELKAEFDPQLPMRSLATLKKGGQFFFFLKIVQQLVARSRATRELSLFFSACQTALSKLTSHSAVQKKRPKLAILLSMCPVDLAKGLTAQKHLFPEYAQMRAHIVTIINSRTRSHVSLMMGSWNEEASNCNAGSEKCTVWTSEMARQSSPNLGTIRAEAIQKVEGIMFSSRTHWPHWC